jgi:hypothetical protein
MYPDKIVSVSIPNKSVRFVMKIFFKQVYKKNDEPKKKVGLLKVF